MKDNIEKPLAPVAAENDENVEVTIEKKLIALYSLQQVDSQIDKIRIIRGELPLEVQEIGRASCRERV